MWLFYKCHYIRQYCLWNHLIFELEAADFGLETISQQTFFCLGWEGGLTCVVASYFWLKSAGLRTLNSCFHYFVFLTSVFELESADLQPFQNKLKRETKFDNQFKKHMFPQRTRKKFNDLVSLPKYFKRKKNTLNHSY